MINLIPLLGTEAVYDVTILKRQTRDIKLKAYEIAKLNSNVTLWCPSFKLQLMLAWLARQHPYRSAVARGGMTRVPRRRRNRQLHAAIALSKLYTYTYKIKPSEGRQAFTEDSHTRLSFLCKCHPAYFRCSIITAPQNRCSGQRFRSWQPF